MWFKNSKTYSQQIQNLCWFYIIVYLVTLPCITSNLSTLLRFYHGIRFHFCEIVQAGCASGSKFNSKKNVVPYQLKNILYAILLEEEYASISYYCKWSGVTSRKYHSLYYSILSNIVHIFVINIMKI